MSSLQIVPVALESRSYDILIGHGLLRQAGEHIIAAAGRRRIVLVSDETVASLHMPALEASLRSSGLDFHVLTVPPGETAKDLHGFAALLERILSLGIDRRTMIVALGGGVIGDLAGFAAATLLRGLEFIQIPTTLLAQIDSAVGGKTGVNARAGKNLVGAFHQPRLVLTDLATLGTLPDRELRAGYAEMVKYGLLGDRGFFEWLEENGSRVLALEAKPLTGAIARCCAMKAEIVGEDEREAGRRALLNLGHTFGHALEAETGYGRRLNHGEGVAIGMAMAGRLSVDLGLLSDSERQRIDAHLTEAGLPIDARQLELEDGAVERVLTAMRADKKTTDGNLNFIVLRGLGNAELAKSIPPAAVRPVLSAACVPA